ncbi:N-acetyltransferase family protein [Azospirillum palustre]
MIIRRMVREDAEVINDIHGVCLTKTLLGRYTQEQVTAWMTGRTSEGYIRASDAGERFFVAEIDGSVVGYASWEGEELLSLFVHPDFQIRGIGSALIGACFVDAGDLSRSITKVKSVLGAEAFYAKHGFTPEGQGSTTKRGVEIPDTRMKREAFCP